MTDLEGQAQPIGHTQQIINALVDLIKVQGAGVFPGHSIWTLPRYDPKTMTAPFMWIFADESDPNDLGWQEKYKYNLTIQVVIVVQQTLIKNRNRAIHRWEQQFQDLIIKNRQPIIDGLRVSKWRIIHLSWIDQPDNVKNIDTVTITLAVDYDRQVFS